jgi:hypothetical protein
MHYSFSKVHFSAFLFSSLKVLLGDAHPMAEKKKGLYLHFLESYVW